MKKNNFRILCFFLFFFLIAGTFCSLKKGAGDNGESNGNGEPPVTCWTASSSLKIRPDSPAGTSQKVHIKAAKNEYESFQVILRDSKEMTVNTISVSSLSGSSGTIDKSNLMVYRVAYININKASNNEGKTGLWPDALIPAVDPFFKETRNAFPVVVKADKNQAFWFDVFVPPGTSAGEYEGKITIDIASENSFDIPVKLTVWNFELPSTSTLVTAFGFDGWENLLGHYGNRDDNVYDMITPLSMLYTECALMNRVSLESAIGEDWSIYPWPATALIDWSDFDKNWGPFFNGKDLAFGLKNAKLTSQGLLQHGDTKNEEIAYIRNFVAHFKKKGWYHILFDYTYDEPHDEEDFDAVKERASLVRQADAGMRLLVTTDIINGKKFAITGIVDIWTPVINAMHDKPGSICWDSEYAGNQRDRYSPFIASGNELWWYQSCESHGCGEGDSRSECFTGWPSYAIDIPAVYNRIMEWLSFKYRISGELYYGTNIAYYGMSGDKDPWNNQYYFWGNGDGTLFYPGRPGKIGGTRHIPVESIRLKMIREGMEDYEYMNLLKELGDESFARSQVNSVVTNTFTFSHDPEVLYGAREKMAERIQAIASIHR